MLKCFLFTVRKNYMQDDYMQFKMGLRNIDMPNDYVYMQPIYVNMLTCNLSMLNNQWY